MNQMGVWMHQSDRSISPHLITKPQRISKYKFIVFVPSRYGDSGVYMYNTTNNCWTHIIQYQPNLHHNQLETTFETIKSKFYVYCTRCQRLIIFNIKEKLLLYDSGTNGQYLRNIKQQRLIVTCGQLNMYAIVRKNNNNNVNRFIYHDDTHQFVHHSKIQTNSILKFRIFKTRYKLYIVMWLAMIRHSPDPISYNIFSSLRSNISWERNDHCMVSRQFGPVQHLPHFMHTVTSVSTDNIFLCNTQSFMRYFNDLILRYVPDTNRLMISTIRMPNDCMYHPVFVHHNIYSIHFVNGYYRRIHKHHDLPSVIGRIILDALANECLHILSANGDHYWTNLSNL